MRIFLAFAVVAALSGCASSPLSGATWKPVSTTDAFTDVTTKMVTVGEFETSRGIYTKSMSLYPFVGTREGELIVGVRSGGRYRIPTGQIQMRIDDNPAWTIATEETPLHLVPDVQGLPPLTGDEKIDASISDAQKKMMASVQRTMSPFTATTGDKAKKILSEMLSGKKLIYRMVGINQAGTTTGEVLLDGSLSQSLHEIGFDQSALNR